MSNCPTPETALAFSVRTRAPAPHEQKPPTMDITSQATGETLQRIPGLYRRWELPQIIELSRLYHLEDAGVHADGTPLVAIYASAPAAGGDQ